MNYDYEIKIKDDFNIKDVNTFFRKVIDNFAKESFLFYREWGEFPFVYRERQVNSVLIPAIYKYTKTIWLEQPFKNDGNIQRFLDIATAKGSNIYLIELKHTFNSKSQKIDERTLNEWDTAIEQISTIKYNTLGNYYADNLSLYKIALMIMPQYLNTKKCTDKSLIKYNEHIYKMFTNKDELDEKGYANLVGTIKINKPNKYLHEWTDKTQIYPFVSFIVRIEKLD